jgi:hypothetical protein
MGRSLESQFGEGVARILGCAEPTSAGDPSTAGSSIVGFRVTEAQRPGRYRLEGRHRFASYALSFEIERGDGDRTWLTAITHAAFPGLLGRAYRALVIGTRGHVLAVHRILRAVRRTAERSR